MRLFTIQRLDLRLFCERLDRSKSPYANRPQIMKAMARLYDEHIHTDQVVWCSLDRPESRTREQSEFVHEIEADQKDVVAILDGLVWEHIIGHTRSIPSDELAKLRHSVSTLREDKCREEQLRRLEDEWLAANVPDDLWGNLIVNSYQARLAQILLAWPFRHSAILSVEPVQR